MSADEPRGNRLVDSAGMAVRSMNASQVRIGDEIVGGWRPGPIVRGIEVADDGELLLVYEYDPADPDGTGTLHTSPWMRPTETVLVWNG